MIHLWWLVVYKRKEPWVVVRSIADDPITYSRFPAYELLCKVYGRKLKLGKDIVVNKRLGINWNTNRKYPNRFRFFCSPNPIDLIPSDKYGKVYTKLVGIDFKNKEILYKIDGCYSYKDGFISSNVVTI